MKNNQRGITLIALIITIVVLLILAAVTITVVTNEDIIFKAKEATKMHQVKEDEQEIELDLNEWAILKYSQQSANFEGFLKDKYGNVEKVSEGTYKVTTKNGNEFTVTETGATYVGTTDEEIQNPGVEVDEITIYLPAFGYISVPRGSTWQYVIDNSILPTVPVNEQAYVACVGDTVHVYEFSTSPDRYVDYVLVYYTTENVGENEPVKSGDVVRAKNFTMIYSGNYFEE